MSEVSIGAPGTIPIRNLWHMFLYAWDKLTLQAAFSATIESSPDPTHLFASLLADSLERRLRRGSPHTYVRLSGEINVIRGKIDFVRSERTNAFRRGRAYCRYDVLSEDTIRSRIFKTTIKRLVDSPLLRSLGKAEIVRGRLARCLLNMSGVGLIEIRRDLFRHEVMGRHDGEDAIILAICELLHLNSMPTTDHGSYRLMLPDWDQRLLRTVFELFVWKCLNRKLSTLGWRVEHNKQLEWNALDESSGLRQYMPSMELDIRLTSPDKKRTIIVDTKFKNVLTKSQYGLRFSSPNIYQIFTYVQSQRGIERAPNEAMLLYPAVDLHISEFADLPSMKLRFETIDLNEPWQSIEKNLVALFV